MERDERYYNRDNRNDDYRRDDQYRRQNDSQMDNFKSRYGSGGNYYGMNDNNAEYRNVRSTGSTAFGSGPSSGPVEGYMASNRRRESDNDNDRSNYRYGDPNPYMSNDRNGGYDRTRGTGWRDNNDRYSHYNSNRTNDRESYSRQDNSYHYGDQGQGRRYNEFGRDERRTYTPNSTQGNNIGSEDAFYDRSDFGHSSSANHFRGGSRSPERDYDQWHDLNNRDFDFRYSGRIQRSDSNDEYSNNEYSASDGDRTSSRQRRSGFSGPDYSANSPAGDYGNGEYRG